MISAIEDDTRLVATRDDSIDIEPTPSVFRSFVDNLVRVREAPEKDDFACFDRRDNENEKSASSRRHFGPIKYRDKRQSELCVSLSYNMLLSADGGH